ncbi:hypothetical protein QCA50_013193 [Cerrena zonata]|uniref:Cytochrome P450 n=1 Tax=Cerrena zonata TaxID=2478898 RepID=A0AAW0G2M8_9APHY
MGTVGILVVTFVVLFLVKRVLDFWNAVKSIHNFPGFRVLLSPNGLPSFLPHIPGISVGGSNKFIPFQMAGTDVFTAVSMFPSVEVNLLVADAAVAKDIMANRFKFPKPIEQYEALTPFGPHIVASEHEQWKKYRKVAAPAFTEPNNKLVWNETVRIVEDLFQNVWGDQKQITYDHALDLTMPMALFVIGAAGFGRRIGWKEELVLPPGHKLTFKDALASVSHNAIMKAILPNWAMNATKKTREVGVAYDELELYMEEMIASRRKDGHKEAKDDLLTGLLDACEGDFEGFSKLSDRELLGNIFIFLIAGQYLRSIYSSR